MYTINNVDHIQEVEPSSKRIIFLGDFLFGYKWISNQDFLASLYGQKEEGKMVDRTK